MRKFFSAILTAAAVLPLFWATVAPNGQKICSEGIAFNYHPDNTTGQAAGKQARTQFCKTVGF